MADDERSGMPAPRWRREGRTLPTLFWPRMRCPTCESPEVYCYGSWRKVRRVQYWRCSVCDARWRVRLVDR